MNGDFFEIYIIRYYFLVPVVDKALEGAIADVAVFIHVTVAVVVQVFPTESMKSKVKLPFHVKVYDMDHELFWTVIDLPVPFNVAITSLLVDVDGL